ncbi:MAG: glycosyltransferase [Vicinamibacterales bacterium]|nr:glycosyltransferase [Vicinamibacterales bacterium]
MKILHLLGWYLPRSVGGTEVYVAALAARQRTAGHDVRVAAPEPGAAGERTYLHERSLVFRYPIAPSPTRAEARQTVPVRGAERLHAWMQEWRPDILHIHTFVTGVGPWEIKAASECGASVVCTTHSGALGFLCARGTLLQWGKKACDGVARPGKCAACLLSSAGLPRPLADVAALIPPSVGAVLGKIPGPVGTALGMTAFIRDNLALQKTILNSLDAFVVLTEAGRRIVVNQAGPDAPVILNRLGIRARPSRVPRKAVDPRAPLTVAYVGRLDAIKGVYDFARAIRATGGRSPIRFEFRAPLNSQQQIQVADRIKRIVGPDARVTFGHPLAPDAVAGYLASIDLLCCPSRTFEGGPTVALEAMAVGTPVVGTRIGGLAEIVEEGVTGRLVAPGDWRALASALEAIAADRTCLERWRAAIGEIRTMDEVAAEYAGLYARIRGRHQAGQS